MKPINGVLFYVNVGHGFRSPTLAIEKELQNLNVSTRMIDALDYFNEKLSDTISKEGWKLMLQHESFFNCIFHSFNSSLMSIGNGILYLKMRKKILEFMKRETPDFVVSTYPLITSVVAKVVNDYSLQTPVFGYNSDAILSHRAYICNSVTKYFVPSKEGYEAMINQGQKKELMEVSAFALDQKFREKFKSVARERKALGLKNVLTLLVVLGGDGIGLKKEIIEALSSLPIQVVVICGRNKKLFSQLQNNQNLIVKGFVDNMHNYLYCCDVLAGKSGINLTFEAIFMKRPFIVIKAMTNERHAAKYLVQKKMGWWEKSENGFISIIKKIVEDPQVLQKARNCMSQTDVSFNTTKIAERIIKLTHKLHSPPR